MLSLGKTIISTAVFEEKFACDLKACKGKCCLHGDSGAPLEEEEGVIIERDYHIISEYMRQEGRDAVRLKGTSMIDSDGDLVTPLIGTAECAYAQLTDGIYSCAIEKAWESGRIKFRKPVSCHLFPVRIKKYAEFDAVNYEEWKLCRPALKRGKEENIPVYAFLRDSLTRMYGKKWYKELLEAANAISGYKSR